MCRCSKQTATVAGSILEKHGHSHNDHFKDVSPETNWISALEHGEKIGIGTMDYELESYKIKFYSIEI